MGIWGSEPKKRKTPGAVLRKLETRLNKRAKIAAKKKEKASIQTKIAAARKKLRGY